MYLVTKPFKGSVLATVQSIADCRIPELLNHFNVNGEWEVVDDKELEVLFFNFTLSLCSDPKTCTEQNFNEMLEILPPCRWDNVSGVEMFHVSEAIYANVVTWYFKYDGAFYSCNNVSTISSQRLADFVKAIHKSVTA